jgi:hypothetical protein
MKVMLSVEMRVVREASKLVVVLDYRLAEMSVVMLAEMLVDQLARKRAESLVVQKVAQTVV